MNSNIRSVITGTGCYLPTTRVRNDEFINHEFYQSDGVRMEEDNKEVLSKFEAITTIFERRYVTDDLMTSDIAYFAALDAIDSSKTDRESLDYIIVAHNFGDIKHNSNRSDFVPSIASRVKHKLEIKNPKTVAYDIAFGCPGWLQGFIQADIFIKSGAATKILVIGAEVLSRVCDPHDRDSMLYADGAGAIIVEGKPSEELKGVLGHLSRTDADIHSDLLTMGPSYHPENENTYLKMNGRKIYQYAVQVVPLAVRQCLKQCNVRLEHISHVLVHQANGKMDEAILKNLYELHQIKTIPENIMPMTVSWLGNSSVATLPTLYDLLSKNKLKASALESGQLVLFASVGAGMNTNALVYKVP